ncbi:hypothetical protein ACWIG5_34410 [Streptomyces lydicus]
MDDVAGLFGGTGLAIGPLVDGIRALRCCAFRDLLRGLAGRKPSAQGCLVAQSAGLLRLLVFSAALSGGCPVSPDFDRSH